jgi:transcription elongation factor SPT5
VFQHSDGSDDEEEEGEGEDDEEDDLDESRDAGRVANGDDDDEEEDLEDLPRRLRNKKLRELAKRDKARGGGGSGSKKKRYRRQMHARDFIQDEVEVDDDEDEDDYDYGDEDLFGNDPSERAEAERAMREQERLRAAGQQRRRNKLAEMTEEELGRYFQERHAKSANELATVDMDDEAYDDITQNQNLPGTKDPNLWIVKCRMGEEKNTCLRLMRKCIAYQDTQEV